jgi:ABC-type Fe3+/spermidine/putrescine transport system ATPase subunit
MRDGRIEQIGTGREVYEQPRTRFVAGFLGDSNLLEGQMTSVTPDAATVQVSGQPVLAPAQESILQGAVVAVCVRPERMRVFPVPAPHPGEEAFENRVQARVQSVIFKGASIEYRLVTPSGVSLLAQVHSDGARPLAQGATVVVGWRKSDCVVLAE